ncbi:hypothetical protein [Devosia aquimaris]|uniref:hypothetical protein n=1 Tax=Devosia aquimaris TaxID=2866214 RepID=UPI001CD09445|nr:hypothetical protein [Devosia sp. CJK-A8-3]
MHKYAVDQTLDLLPSHGSTTRRAAPCRIVALLPYEGRQVQYKVQSSLESYQRIVSEADLRLPAQLDQAQA